MREVEKLPKADISPTTLELLGYLVRAADNETGDCWGFQETIAAALHRDPRTIRRATRELERLQLIAYRPGGQRPGEQRPRPCRFKLLEGRTHSPQEADTVSAPAGGHAAREGRTHSPQEADTVSALTAVVTTKGTNPPQPPKGGRARDRHGYRAELRAWTAHAGYAHASDEVCVAVELRGATTLEAVIANLPPHLRQPRWPNSKPTRGAGEDADQLELPL